ncbi:cytochrome p450 [Holotrichia oblita]|uniref:Cytochrome p450 n=1 Tax=Holotrichia oblita TaxID=644536 RepID=A0ACB9SZP9_HOLOL|nr:cytochrome p450 [Holotrichia oblita]
MLSWKFLLNIFSVFIATFILILLFYKKRFNYWKNRGIEYLEPSIIYGNTKENFTKGQSFGTALAEVYHRMKAKNLIHAGYYLFHRPGYIPIDLKLIKLIMQVDFAHFTDRPGYINEKDDPLSAHLGALGGERWRSLRVKLTPTFTSGKLKLMFPIMVEISNELIKVLDKECQNGPVEAKDISARYTTDVIGTCAFGLDCNSLKDPNTEFRTKGSRAFELTRLEQLSGFVGFLFPDFAKFCGIRQLPKEASDFFLNIIRNNVEFREKNNFRRNDAFQMLLDMKNEENDSNTRLTFNELAAQAFVFFGGGFETSSTTMSFVLLELALNQDVQIKLRDEINTVMNRYNNEIVYEALGEMQYLDMVINESLRKYPPIPINSRECNKDYKVPNTDLVLPKGQAVFIPTQGIHYDPEYYPDPEKFDPMRFSVENMSKLPQFAFMPFGGGPRICLGQRFALIQSKVGLISLVQNFKFKINSKTEIPVKLDPVKFFTGTIGGLWLDVERIN